MSNLETAVKDFLLRYDLIDYKGNVLIAFSGGFDSLCLLHFLKTHTNLNLIAIHLNHNWRGEESLKEELNCKNFCNKSGIEIYCEKLSPDISKTETAAREARYKFFEACAKRYNSSVIFTAHNADDNAETVLYRIIKGTAVDGLSAILENRGIYYRPLLKVLRKDIESYCNNNYLLPNLDSSNSDIKYSRNFIRHKILPELKKLNPDVISAINSLSELAAMDSEYLNNLSNGTGSSTEKFLQAPKNMQCRIIKNLLTKNELDYDKDKLEGLSDKITEYSSSKSGKTASLSEDLFLYVNSKEFKIIRQNAKSPVQIKIDKVGEYNLEDYTFTVEKCSKLPDKFPIDSENTAYVKLDKVDYVLRTRKDGDYIYPLGINGKQKLKKYLNEKKIPQHTKDRHLFLCDGAEVLWAIGLGISDKIKVIDKPTHILKLNKKKG